MQIERQAFVRLSNTLRNARLADPTYKTILLAGLMVLFACGGPRADRSTPSGTNPTPSGNENPNTTNTTNTTNTSPSADLGALLSVGHNPMVLADELVSFTAQAVYQATLGSGAALTLAGTLTQVGSSDTFTYAPSPSDALVVTFSNGKSLRLAITVFEGYFQGSLDDFLKQHRVELHITSTDVDLQLSSNARTNQKTDSEKRLTGTLVDNGETLTVDLSQSVQLEQEVDYSWAKTDLQRHTTGSVTSASAVYTINEHNWFLYQAYDGTHARNFEIRSDSTAQINGTTYQLAGFRARWEDATIFNGGRNEDKTRTIEVSEPDYWIAEGAVLKEGQPHGSVQFDGPVIKGSKGPSVSMQWQNGETQHLFNPIERP